MARRRDDVADLLRRIDRLSEEQQCEILEGILRRTRSPEEIFAEADAIRARLPRRSEREVKRDADAAIGEVRREFARERRR